ncbi:hypothetical protein HZB69_00220 [Candidatus Amesbacteria bacterium]|nr:hypothetical protein [Candidatus Amesbacteria bacterium]
MDYDSAAEKLVNPDITNNLALKNRIKPVFLDEKEIKKVIRTELGVEQVPWNLDWLYNDIRLIAGFVGSITIGFIGAFAVTAIIIYIAAIFGHDLTRFSSNELNWFFVISSLIFGLWGFAAMRGWAYNFPLLRSYFTRSTPGTFADNLNNKGTLEYNKDKRIKYGIGPFNNFNNLNNDELKAFEKGLDYLTKPEPWFTPMRWVSLTITRLLTIVGQEKLVEGRLNEWLTEHGAIGLASQEALARTYAYTPTSDEVEDKYNLAKGLTALVDPAMAVQSFIHKAKEIVWGVKPRKPRWFDFWNKLVIERNQYFKDFKEFKGALRKSKVNQPYFEDVISLTEPLTGQTQKGDVPSKRHLFSSVTEIKVNGRTLPVIKEIKDLNGGKAVAVNGGPAAMYTIDRPADGIEIIRLIVGTAQITPRLKGYTGPYLIDQHAVLTLTRTRNSAGDWDEVIDTHNFVTALDKHGKIASWRQIKNPKYRVESLTVEARETINGVSLPTRQNQTTKEIYKYRINDKAIYRAGIISPEELLKEQLWNILSNFSPLESEKGYAVEVPKTIKNMFKDFVFWQQGGEWVVKATVYIYNQIPGNLLTAISEYLQNLQAWWAFTNPFSIVNDTSYKDWQKHRSLLTTITYGWEMDIVYWVGGIGVSNKISDIPELLYWFARHQKSAAAKTSGVLDITGKIIPGNLVELAQKLSAFAFTIFIMVFLYGSFIWLGYQALGENGLNLIKPFAGNNPAEPGMFYDFIFNIIGSPEDVGIKLNGLWTLAVENWGWSLLIGFAVLSIGQPARVIIGRAAQKFPTSGDTFLGYQRSGEFSNPDNNKAISKLENKYFKGLITQASLITNTQAEPTVKKDELDGKKILFWNEFTEWLNELTEQPDPELDMLVARIMEADNSYQVFENGDVKRYAIPHPSDPLTESTQLRTKGDSGWAGVWDKTEGFRPPIDILVGAMYNDLQAKNLKSSTIVEIKVNGRDSLSRGDGNKILAHDFFRELKDLRIGEKVEIVFWDMETGDTIEKRSKYYRVEEGTKMGMYLKLMPGDFVPVTVAPHGHTPSPIESTLKSVTTGPVTEYVPAVTFRHPLAKTIFNFLPWLIALAISIPAMIYFVSIVTNIIWSGFSVNSTALTTPLAYQYTLLLSGILWLSINMANFVYYSRPYRRLFTNMPNAWYQELGKMGGRERRLAWQAADYKSGIELKWRIPSGHDRSPFSILLDWFDLRDKSSLDPNWRMRATLAPDLSSEIQEILGQRNPTQAKEFTLWRERRLLVEKGNLSSAAPEDPDIDKLFPPAVALDNIQENIDEFGGLDTILGNLNTVITDNMGSMAVLSADEITDDIRTAVHESNVATIDSRDPDPGMMTYALQTGVADVKRYPGRYKTSINNRRTLISYQRMNLGGKAVRSNIDASGLKEGDRLIVTHRQRVTANDNNAKLSQAPIAYYEYRVKIIGGVKTLVRSETSKYTAKDFAIDTTRREVKNAQLMLNVFSRHIKTLSKGAYEFPAPKWLKSFSGFLRQITILVPPIPLVKQAAGLITWSIDTVLANATRVPFSAFELLFQAWRAEDALRILEAKTETNVIVGQWRLSVPLRIIGGWGGWNIGFIKIPKIPAWNTNYVLFKDGIKFANPLRFGTSAIRFNLWMDEIANRPDATKGYNPVQNIVLIPVRLFRVMLDLLSLVTTRLGGFTFISNADDMPDMIANLKTHQPANVGNEALVNFRGNLGTNFWDIYKKIGIILGVFLVFGSAIGNFIENILKPNIFVPLFKFLGFGNYSSIFEGNQDYDLTGLLRPVDKDTQLNLNPLDGPLAFVGQIFTEYIPRFIYETGRYVSTDLLKQNIDFTRLSFDDFLSIAITILFLGAFLAAAVLPLILFNKKNNFHAGVKVEESRGIKETGIVVETGADKGITDGLDSIKIESMSPDGNMFISGKALVTGKKGLNVIHESESKRATTSNSMFFISDIMKILRTIGDYFRSNSMAEEIASFGELRAKDGSHIYKLFITENDTTIEFDFVNRANLINRLNNLTDDSFVTVVSATTHTPVTAYKKSNYSAHPTWRGQWNETTTPQPLWNSLYVGDIMASGGPLEEYNASNIKGTKLFTHYDDRIIANKKNFTRDTDLFGNYTLGEGDILEIMAFDPIGMQKIPMPYLVKINPDVGGTGTKKIYLEYIGPSYEPALAPKPNLPSDTIRRVNKLGNYILTILSDSKTKVWPAIKSGLFMAVPLALNSSPEQNIINIAVFGSLLILIPALLNFLRIDSLMKRYAIVATFILTTVAVGIILLGGLSPLFIIPSLTISFYFSSVLLSNSKIKIFQLMMVLILALSAIGTSIWIKISPRSLPQQSPTSMATTGSINTPTATATKIIPTTEIVATKPPEVTKIYNLSLPLSDIAGSNLNKSVLITISSTDKEIIKNESVTRFNVIKRLKGSLTQGGVIYVNNLNDKKYLEDLLGSDPINDIVVLPSATVNPPTTVVTPTKTSTPQLGHGNSIVGSYSKPDPQIQIQQTLTPESADTAAPVIATKEIKIETPVSNTPQLLKGLMAFIGGILLSIAGILAITKLKLLSKVAGYNKREIFLTVVVGIILGIAGAMALGFIALPAGLPVSLGAPTAAITSVIPSFPSKAPRSTFSDFAPDVFVHIYGHEGITDSQILDNLEGVKGKVSVEGVEDNVTIDKALIARFYSENNIKFVISESNGNTRTISRDATNVIISIQKAQKPTIIQQFSKIGKAFKTKFSSLPTPSPRVIRMTGLAVVMIFAIIAISLIVAAALASIGISGFVAPVSIFVGLISSVGWHFIRSKTLQMAMTHWKKVLMGLIIALVIAFSFAIAKYSIDNLGHPVTPVEPTKIINTVGAPSITPTKTFTPPATATNTQTLPPTNTAKSTTPIVTSTNTPVPPTASQTPTHEPTSTIQAPVPQTIALNLYETKPIDLSKLPDMSNVEIFEIQITKIFEPGPGGSLYKNNTPQDAAIKIKTIQRELEKKGFKGTLVLKTSIIKPTKSDQNYLGTLVTELKSSTIDTSGLNSSPGITPTPSGFINNLFAGLLNFLKKPQQAGDDVSALVKAFQDHRTEAHEKFKTEFGEILEDQEAMKKFLATATDTQIADLKTKIGLEDKGNGNWSYMGLDGKMNEIPSGAVNDNISNFPDLVLLIIYQEEMLNRT